MAIDKSVGQAPLGIEELAATQPDLSIEIENPESVTLDDGSMEITITPGKETNDEFNANLAEDMDEGQLTELAGDLVGEFDADVNSRKDWLTTYVDGLELLGLKVEDRTEPWPGACNVYHPLMTEALVKFQAETMMETFPQIKPNGRVSKALGFEKGVPEELVRKKMAEGNDSFYDFMYGGTMGNNQPGDGWKYRGRGLVAITGKSNYAAVSKTLAKMGVNVDLVSNPDRLREPDIAYKAAVAYYINTLAKGDVKKGLERLNSYTSQDQALREIIRATAGMGHDPAAFELGYKNNRIENGVAKGEHLFVNYERAKGYSSLADQIISMSSENSQMRQQSAAPAGPGTTNNFNLPQPAAAGQQNRPVVDDRSPYSRKSTQ